MATSKIQSKEDPSTESYIILLEDSEWVMINKHNDSEQDCSLSDIEEKPHLDKEFAEVELSTVASETSASNGGHKMPQIEEILNLSPIGIDPFIFEGIEDEADTILIYSTDDQSAENSESTDESDENKSKSDASLHDLSPSSSSDSSHDDSKSSSDDSLYEGVYDPTLIFENMNYHRSPLYNIFEESTEYDDSICNGDIEQHNALGLLEEYACENTKHDYAMFTEPLLDLSTYSINSFSSESNYEDILLIQNEGIVYMNQKRAVMPGETLEDFYIEDLDNHQRTTTPGDSGFETDQDIFHDQSSEFSEESSFDEPRIYMDKPLDRNQCLEVVSKLNI